MGGRGEPGARSAPRVDGNELASNSRMKLTGEQFLALAASASRALIEPLVVAAHRALLHRVRSHIDRNAVWRSSGPAAYPCGVRMHTTDNDAAYP